MAGGAVDIVLADIAHKEVLGKISWRTVESLELRDYITRHVFKDDSLSVGSNFLAQVLTHNTLG